MASDLSAFGRARFSEVALLTGPAALLLGLFVVLPFLLAVAFSLSNAKLLQQGPIEWAGADNYVRMFAVRVVPMPTSGPAADPILPSRQWRAIKRAQPEEFEGWQFLGDVSLGSKHWLIGARDPLFLRSVLNTFVFAVMVVPLQTLLAFGMALWVNQKFSGRVLLRTVFFAPVVSSMVVVSAIWGLILHSDEGLLNQWLLAVLGPAAPQPDWLGDSHWAMLAIAVMSAWQGAGFQMLIFLAGLQGVPPEQYEAALVMGASRWQRFFYITLPSLRGTFVFVLLSTTVAAFGLFTQVDVLTHGGPQDSTSTVIFHAVRVGFREQDIAYGSAMMLFFFVFVLLISVAQRALSARGRA